MPQFLVSPCCQEKVRKFGSRRLQCTNCFKTWRSKQKKRGRKKLRVNRQMLVNYLSRQSSSLKVSLDSLRRRRRSSLNAYLNHSQFEYPQIKGPLIIVVDAMWQVIENQECTVYFTLARAINSKQAFILPPVMIPGPESANGWQITWENIPANYRKHIKALVCDGYPHLVRLAKREKLLVQRCHFHLLASIKNYVSAGPKTRSGSLGKLVLTAIQTALNTSDEQKLQDILDEIWTLTKVTNSQKLKARLKGFLRDIDDFRTYQLHPELNLPTTSNAAESLVQCIRDLLYRARGFRTANSFIKWIKAVCLFKKTILCNGKRSTN